MPKSTKDPSEALHTAARALPEVEEGRSCTQTSYKTKGKAFLYLGMQGGRHKAMFKLRDSMPEAEALAEKSPEDFQTGSTGWVTARFSDEKPLPKRLWSKWLKESYALGRPTKK